LTLGYKPAENTYDIFRLKYSSFCPIVWPTTPVSVVVNLLSAVINFWIFFKLNAEIAYNYATYQDAFLLHPSGISYHMSLSENQPGLVKMTGPGGKEKYT
jgi:hypothetical protein